MPHDFLHNIHQLSFARTTLPHQKHNLLRHSLTSLLSRQNLLKLRHHDGKEVELRRIKCYGFSGWR